MSIDRGSDEQPTGVDRGLKRLSIEAAAAGAGISIASGYRTEANPRLPQPRQSRGGGDGQTRLSLTENVVTTFRIKYLIYLVDRV